MTKDWTLIKKIKGYKSLVWVEDRLLLCKGNVLYFFEPENERIYKFLSVIHKNNFQLLSSVGIINRLLRLHISYAFYSPKYKKLFVIADGIILTIDLGNSEVIGSFRLPRGNRALNMTEICGSNGFSEGVYFGEYFNNASFGSVDIYRWHPNHGWKVIHTFAKDTIYHIHNLIVDLYRDVVYCFTGDLNEHSAIWEFKNDFKVVKKLFSGDQIYRACVGLVDRGKLIYPTDSQLNNNFLCEIKFGNNECTHDILYELEGSVIYASKFKDEFIFSTTVEPDAFSTKTSLISLMSRTRGKGIKSNDIHLLTFDTLKKNLKIIYKNKKDLLPYSLFQFGTMIPSINTNSGNHLAVYCNATINFDNTTLIFKQID